MGDVVAGWLSPGPGVNSLLPLYWIRLCSDYCVALASECSSVFHKDEVASGFVVELNDCLLVDSPGLSLTRTFV